jgi:protein-S-isoprenylcysteine O-methyltransferase Ste14
MTDPRPDPSSTASTRAADPAAQAAASRAQSLGALLVVAQFALIGLIAWKAGPFFLALQASALAWAVLAAGIALGFWAIATNRPGNFNIRPTPKAGAALVTAGPYAWIRHPMYSAILLMGLAGIYGVDIPGRTLVGTAFFALLGVLWVKAGIEEKLMLASHPGYADYMKQSSKFIPWLM